MTGWKTSGTTGRLLVLIGASGIATLGLIVLAALWAGAESDLAALDRQRQLVTARLREQVEQVAKDIDQIALGYASLASPASRPVDGLAGPSAERAGAVDPVAAAAASRIATSIFGYDETFVVDEAERLVGGGDAELERRYKWMRPLLKPLLAEVRAADAAAPAIVAGQNPTAETGARRTALAHLMRLQGRPTIVGVVALHEASPSAPKGAIESAKPAYLQVIRFLDGAALDELSREQGLNGARFARSADADETEVAFQIDATATGEPIGFIIWSPDLPGSRVVGRLVPALSITAFIIAVLFSFLLVRLRWSLQDLRTSEHQARHLALHDVLTGLPNRALFKTRLDACLAESETGARSALVLIDLDRFKIVNDTHGHAAGDDLIRQSAERMRSTLRPSDVLARLGGDEFALLVEKIGPTADEATRQVEAILARLSEPFVLLGGKVAVQIGASLGIAILPDAGTNADDLLRFADVALYEAKHAGRGRWVTFDASMDKGRNERESLRSDLRALLGSGTAGPDHARPLTLGPSRPSDCGTLELHVQPVHRAADNALSGAEALVRWRHGRHGLLYPDRFIALAEESGLIDALGLWVLKEACSAAADWPAELFIAVNVSPAQLRHPDFADRVLAILAETGLSPHRLELELTESALIHDDQATKMALFRLRAEGILIALDDFGTGYSSLSHLIQFSIDRIKIDRSFVALLGTKANGAAIVAAVVSLARSLGMATTAEGVENAEQRDFLGAVGCGDLQGYGFAKPMPLDAFDRYRHAVHPGAEAEARQGTVAA